MARRAKAVAEPIDIGFYIGERLTALSRSEPSEDGSDRWYSFVRGQKLTVGQVVRYRHWNPYYKLPTIIEAEVLKVSADGRQVDYRTISSLDLNA